MVDGLVDKGWVRFKRELSAARTRGVNGRTAPHDGSRSNDFALLCATGKPFSGNCGWPGSTILVDNPLTARPLQRPGEIGSGGFMDLAMAMGVALFGMFAASTVYFFYKLER
ncbi:hypothetical protein PQQ86_13885 [Paraburkholderia sediminicola]|jgi:hypothetical protein|uniref:hypothetical protein n=1 Tax=Paraburkholderia sediminicola TaxID=458836 RepID=UPI0038BD5AD5